MRQGGNRAAPDLALQRVQGLPDQASTLSLNRQCLSSLLMTSAVALSSLLPDPVMGLINSCTMHSTHKNELALSFQGFCRA